MRLSRHNSTRFNRIILEDQTDQSLPLIERCRGAIEHFFAKHQRVIVPMMLLFLLLPIWVSLGDHGFNGRSDARYAVVSMDMAQSGDWLVPRYMGKVHLTKPPLVYWLQSASIETLGKSYFAVRLPSAIFATLSVLLLYNFGKRQMGIRVGLFAAAIYAVMPMTIFPARMTVTDSVVNFFWMMIVFTGYLSVKHPTHKRWGVLLWVAASFGMLAKGPVLFIPVGVIGVWRLIQSRDVSAADEQSSNTAGPVRVVGVFVVGLILAMLPALLWAYAVYAQNPEAVGIWLHETLDRASGSGDHAKPIWFFIPVLLGGCFPASAMLLLPGVNLRWKTAIQSLRNGSLEGYLGWAVIAPFVVYSLISGKLASYLLPVCAPLALLSAMMLEQWFTTKGTPQPGVGRRIPEVRWGLFVGTLLFAIGIGTAAGVTYGLHRIVWVYGLVFALIAAGFLVKTWNDQRWRVMAMGLFLGSWIVGWSTLEELEDIALEQMSYIAKSHQTFGAQGWQGLAGVYQLEDGMIYWDESGNLEQFETSGALRTRLDELGDEPILILTAAQQWDLLEDSDPAVFSSFDIANEWYQWPGAPKRYLLVSHRVSQ